jgi:hypothetical protein
VGRRRARTGAGYATGCGGWCDQSRGRSARRFQDASLDEMRCSSHLGRRGLASATISHNRGSRDRTIRRPPATAGDRLPS